MTSVRGLDQAPPPHWPVGAGCSEQFEQIESLGKAGRQSIARCSNYARAHSSDRYQIPPDPQIEVIKCQEMDKMPRASARCQEPNGDAKQRVCPSAKHLAGSSGSEGCPKSREAAAAIASRLGARRVSSTSNFHISRNSVRSSWNSISLGNAPDWYHCTSITIVGHMDLQTVD